MPSRSHSLSNARIVSISPRVYVRMVVSIPQSLIRLPISSTAVTQHGCCCCRKGVFRATLYQPEPLAGIEESLTVLKVLRPLILAAIGAALITLLAGCAKPSPTPVPTLGVPVEPVTQMASNGVPNQITAIEQAAFEQA